MNGKKITLLAVLTVNAALCACAGTPYQPANWTGGYKDAHIRDNLYYVEFSGNALLDTVTAAQYFHRRAREVCQENGYSDYRISQEKDITGLQAIGSSSGATVLQKPGLAGYVECLSTSEAIAVAAP